MVRKKEVPKEISEYMAELGRKSGKKRLKERGREFFVEMSQKAKEARERKKNLS